MKKLYCLFGIVLGFTLLLASCVDEFEDANPPRRLDAPDVKLIASADTVFPGDVVNLTINITDAPGGIDSLVVNYNEALGTLVYDPAAFEALKGTEKGSFTATWTASTENVGGAPIQVTVFDSQAPRKSGSFTSSVFIDYAFDAPEFELTPDVEGTDFFGGDEVTFTMNITSPGGIGNVSVDDGGLGTVTIDPAQLEQIKGSNTGVLSVKYKTPNQVGEIPVNFTVFDNTGTKQPSEATVMPFTVDSCAYTGLIAGIYESVAEGDVGWADSTYTLSSTVTLLQPYPGVGIIQIDDLSFGLYPEIYDRATLPTGTINLCDGTITERKATDVFGDPFTITGTVNANGTISIEWSNENGDSGEVTLTKKI